MDKKQAKLQADHLSALCADELEEVLNKYDASIIARDGAALEIVVYIDDDCGSPVKGEAYLETY